MRFRLAHAGSARAFHQPPLRIRHRARAHQDDPGAFEPVQQRQSVHVSQSGTRSASMMAAGAIRSATTA